MEIEAVASWGRLDWCGHNGMAAELPIEMKERSVGGSSAVQIWQTVAGR